MSKNRNRRKILKFFIAIVLIVSLGTSSLILMELDQNDGITLNASAQSSAPEGLLAAPSEEPKAEEPKAEESKAEEPKAEEPKVEEPKIDDKVIETEVPENKSVQKIVPAQTEKMEEEVNSIMSISGYSGRGVGSIGSIMTSTNLLDYVSPITGLQVSKTATVHSIDRSIFKLDLTATATSEIVIPHNVADIILVLDSSSSLNGNMDGSSTKREAAVKGVATDFVDDIAKYSPKSKVAVVLSKKDETTNSSLLSVEKKKSNIINWINNFNTKGSNDIAAGLKRASNIYNNTTYDPDRARIVILITGGTAGENVMADSIQCSAILKGSHSKTIDPSDILLKNSEGERNYPTASRGCNALVYSIGIFTKANSDTNECLWRTSSNSPSAGTISKEYMPNGSNSYYLTSKNTEDLRQIFSGITQQLGAELKDAVVRDYVDPRFDIVDENGNKTNTINVEGKTAVVKTDSNGVYVEWLPQVISPESEEHKAISFAGSFYVKPKEDFIGGNNIPTNVKNITGVYVNNKNIGSFPNPLVNIPFRLSISNISDDIFLGECIPESVEKAQSRMIEQKLKYKYPDEMITLIWNPSFSDTEKPVATTVYNLTVSLLPKDDIVFSDEWIQSGTDYTNNAGEIYHKAVGNVATVLKKNGTYTVNVRTGTLTIQKKISGLTNPNQTFVFEIKQYNNPDKTKLIKTYYETIRVKDIASNRSVIHLPKGYYEVKEKSDWSWQYQIKGKKIQVDTLGMNAMGKRDIGKTTISTSFTNESKTGKWLTSMDWVVNKFTGGGNE